MHPGLADGDCVLSQQLQHGNVSGKTRRKLTQAGLAGRAWPHATSCRTGPTKAPHLWYLAPVRAGCPGKAESMECWLRRLFGVVGRTNLQMVQAGPSFVHRTGIAPLTPAAVSIKRRRYLGNHRSHSDTLLERLPRHCSQPRDSHRIHVHELQCQCPFTFSIIGEQKGQLSAERCANPRHSKSGPDVGSTISTDRGSVEARARSLRNNGGARAAISTPTWTAATVGSALRHATGTAASRRGFEQDVVTLETHLQLTGASDGLYDQQTNHGLNTQAQSRWDAAFLARLAAVRPRG